MRAVISVSNKALLLPFVQGITSLGWDIIATGDTTKTLRDAGFSVVDGPQHFMSTIIAEMDLNMLDMVVVNFQPFEEAIGQIDIDGPAIIRAAAKNHERMIVVVDPNDYVWVVSELELHGEVRSHLRRSLAEKVFDMTAKYDRAIANYFKRS